MRLTVKKNGFLCAALCVLMTFSAHSALASDASYGGTIPNEWQVCAASDDCIAVRDNDTCAVIAVNKKFQSEAADFTAKQPGGKSTGMDGQVRCLHQPDAECLNNACALLVHPE